MVAGEFCLTDDTKSKDLASVMVIIAKGSIVPPSTSPLTVSDPAVISFLYPISSLINYSDSDAGSSPIFANLASSLSAFVKASSSSL